MKWHSCSLVPAVLIFATVAQGLLVIGPQKLRTNRRYTMVISNFLTDRGDLSLKLIDNANSTVYITKTVDVLPRRNRLVEFDVPDGLAAGGYAIIIEGQRGFTFHEEIEVYVEEKSFSGLIQLDKPVYKPGETVNFRVIVLDSDLKPPKNVTSVSVAIENSKGLKVRKWDAARLQIGVFEGSFPIASSPELGTYNVIVKSGDEILVSKTFEVKEFARSSFDVDVFPTTVPLEEHQGLNLTISAKNVFGKPVSGKVDLTLFSTGSGLEVKATREIDGMAQLEMRFYRQLNIYDEFDDVNLNFTFTEQYTNRSIAKSLPITVYKTKYTAKLIKETPEFRPGMVFRATVKVEHRDGSPARFVNCGVKVDGLEEPYDKKFLTDDDGEITLELKPSETESILIRVSVGEHTIMENTIEKAQQTTGVLLKIARKSGLPIKLQVTCRPTAKFLVYFVLAKGNVIEEGFISSPKTWTNIILKNSGNMVPQAKVFVATVANNIVVYDMVDIAFPDLLNNFDMEVEHKQVKPGEQIQLNMMGRPGSYVALAAYDESLLQYGPTHDIYWSDVLKLYDSFHGIDENQFDIFQGIGLFARVSSGVTLDTAISKIGRDGRKAAKLVPVRKNFAESFLWRNATIDKTERLILEENTPHTMTVWCLTGFSMHPVYGLGIIQNPGQLKTINTFYLVDHLPYSIKQDEEVELQFTIFNHLEADYDTQVTLFKFQDQFEFMESSPNGKLQTKTLTVKQAQPATVFFQVKAKKLGEMVVRVQADNGRETDIIEKVIQVLPKSLVVTGMDTRLFSIAGFSNKTFELKTNIDKNADEDSIKITLSIEPNLLSGVMENLKKLIDVPIGSGESNMINFIPHVAVLDYITAINPFHPVIEATKKFLRQGYQNQLKYRQADGSFKDFEGTQSSIFLTAFVAKSLQNAAKYLPEVDPKMVNQAYEWLATKQHSSGRFDEVGPILLQHLQTNARKSIGLTSYVLIAFLENSDAKGTHSSVIEKGIEYVSIHIDEIEDSFDLAIATYALSLYNSESNVTATLRGTLMSKSKMDANNGEIHWPRETHSIETTAYALLAIVKAENLLYNGVLIMRWLVNQRHASGSFPRTQDTFIGLQALAKLVETLTPERNDYTIDINIPKDGGGIPTNHILRISQHDTLSKSFEDIPSDTKKLNIAVAGTGLGLASLKYEYSLALRNYNHRFNLTLVKERDSNTQLELNICARFLPIKPDERSSMALVEVNFPSGYEVDNDPISKVTGDRPIKKDIRFGATSVVLYYENMGSEENCFVVTAYRRFKVTMRRPANVVIHDFYNPQYNAMQIYNTIADEL